MQATYSTKVSTIEQYPEIIFVFVHPILQHPRRLKWCQDVRYISVMDFKLLAFISLEAMTRNTELHEGIYLGQWQLQQDLHDSSQMNQFPSCVLSVVNPLTKL